MKILLATHNPSKLKRYQSLWSDFKDLDLVSLSDLGIEKKVAEPYNEVLDNAIIKAKEYASLSQLPVLAIDEALKTNFLPDSEQPGAFVRRFGGDKKELSDLEILETWKKIFQAYPNIDYRFIWTFALAYYHPQQEKLKTTLALPVYKVQIPFSKKIDPGYPMSSFMVPLDYDRPYVDLSPAERLAVDRKNLASFTNLLKSILGYADF